MNNKIKTNNKFKYLIGLWLISSLLSSCDMLIHFPSADKSSNFNSIANSIAPSYNYDIKRYDYLQFKDNSIYSAYKDEAISLYQNLYGACKNVLENNADYNSQVICQIKYENLDVVKAVYFSFLHNNPEFYFLKNGFQYTMGVIDGMFCDVINVLFDDEYISSSVRAVYNEKIQNYKEGFLIAFEPIKNAGDITQSFFIHDYVCESTYYEYINKSPSTKIQAHNIIGVIDNDSSTGSVCEGYAKTYQLLCDLVGIETITVVGQISDGVGHMWNYTKHIFSCYGVDTTWDGGNFESVTHKYCLANRKTMDEDHIVDDSSINAESFQVPVPDLAN